MHRDTHIHSTCPLHVHNACRLLRVRDILSPTNPAMATPRAKVWHVDNETEVRIKADVARAADLLFEDHAEQLPKGCSRAVAHLQMASLALAAQRTLFDAANAPGGEFEPVNTLEVRSVVAGSLGVLAPADGTPPTAVPVMWIPNRLAMLFNGAFLLSGRKRVLVERMWNNFETDLGAGFAFEPLADPLPEGAFLGQRMKRCLYHEFCREEGAHELAPIFSAMHSATFAGIPGFSFKEELAAREQTGPSWTFRFDH